ncbi:MAG: glycosyltransferase family 2 protein [Lachnospiraceae bacterium]|nr:glycosyltransferase family 2 protein [Lachnospiraceae bacterium]
MKKVSVIIPTYNRADKLMISVNSVLEQTYSNLELIIVDDGSQDHTRQVVEGIADERVRYVALPQNGGVSIARNTGAECATSDIIAFQDSDDAWRPDKLEKQMDYWRLHPEFEMVYCSYMMHKYQFEYIVPAEHMEGPMEGDIFSWLILRNSIGAPTMVMKRESFLKVGGFDSSMRSLEDWEFVIRFAREYQIGFVDEVLMDVYYSNVSVTSQVAAYFESRCRMITTYKEQLLACGFFDAAVNDMFQRASNLNVLDMVKKMLIQFLSMS